LTTWRNGRGKHDFVAKRLDHFLISENLVESSLGYRSWVANVKLSDHIHVVLQFDQEKKNIKLPLIFNLVWLKDPDFVLLVHSNWKKLIVSDFSSPMDKLVQKLKLLKSLVKKWERNKKLK
jgi:hypothetical protein